MIPILYMRKTKTQGDGVTYPGSRVPLGFTLRIFGHYTILKSSLSTFYQ